MFFKCPSVRGGHIQYNFEFLGSYKSLGPLETARPHSVLMNSDNDVSKVLLTIDSMSDKLDLCIENLDRLIQENHRLKANLESVTAAKFATEVELGKVKDEFQEKIKDLETRLLDEINTKASGFDLDAIKDDILDRIQ